MAYDNTNSGAMFPNDKQKSTHPDFKGSINVDGVEYWISAWCKTSGPSSKKPGQDFLSLSISPKDESREGQRKTNVPKNDATDFLSRVKNGTHKQHTDPEPRKPAPRTGKQQNFDDSFDDDIPF